MIYQLTKCLPTRSDSFNPRSRHDLARARTGRAFRRLLHCSWNVSSAVCSDLSRRFPISRDPPTFFLFYSTRGSKGIEARELGSDIDRHFLGLNLTSAGGTDWACSVSFTDGTGRYRHRLRWRLKNGCGSDPRPFGSQLPTETRTIAFIFVAYHRSIDFL